MATSATVPIALDPDEGEAFWFLGSLAIIKASSEDTAGRVTVLDHLSSRGNSPALHVHHTSDEMFYVTEGDMTFWIGGQTILATAGSFVYGPRGIPHTFAVTSAQARFLLVSQPAGFDGFVRAMGEPALQLVIPPPATEPPDIARLVATAAQHGIEVVGPPGIPD